MWEHNIEMELQKFGCTESGSITLPCFPDDEACDFIKDTTRLEKCTLWSTLTLQRCCSRHIMKVVAALM
jgi:hypothetical protein